MNTKNRGNNEKTRGQEAREGMIATRNGRAGYHRGSSNFAAESTNLGVYGMSMEDFRGSHGGENGHGASHETGFASFTQS